MQPKVIEVIQCSQLQIVVWSPTLKPKSSGGPQDRYVPNRYAVGGVPAAVIWRQVGLQDVQVVTPARIAELMAEMLRYIDLIM
jgi:hypothetical protein